MDTLFILLVIVILVIGIGVGVTITVNDFYHAFKLPTAILTGLFSQILFMPLMAYILAIILDLPVRQATGLILVGCAPGGGLSNLFCMWIGGDVSLSITMTTASTLFASFMIPLNVLVYVKGALGADDGISMDWGGLFGTLGTILFGTVVGMFIATQVSDKTKIYIEKTGSACGILVLIAAFVVGLNDNKHLFSESWKVYLAASSPEPLGLIFGYGVSKYILRLEEKYAQTISLETGLQNIALIMAICEISFTDDDVKKDVLKVPLLASLAYAFWTILILVIFCFIDSENNGEDKETELSDIPSSASNI